LAVAGPGGVAARAAAWPAASRAGRAVTGGELLAVLLALAASCCFAFAAVTQQGAAAHLPSRRAFDPAVLARLARRPAWLAGLAAVIAGFSLQAAALGLGRLVVIEPVLATGLLFALVLSARRDQRPLRAAEWAAALAVVAGLAAAAAAVLIGLCAILAGRFTPSRRALLLGVGGGAAAGATDALTKSVTVLAAAHPLALFADTRLYLLAVVGLLTYTIQQNGYRAARLAAFLPAFAVVEPVSGALLGLIIYHERVSGGPGQIAVELAACAAAAWGITRLAGSAMATREQPDSGPAWPILAGPATGADHGDLAGPVAVSGTDET
jgi:hypothetical protein